MQECKALLERLTQPIGVSGFEESIRAVIQKEIEGCVDMIAVDAMGNLIAVKKAEGPKVMLAAHMDRIGWMITGIDENGFLRAAPVGGLPRNVITGRAVRFENGTRGIVYFETKTGNGYDVPFEKMYIDIGAADEKAAAEKVKIGDVACYDAPFIDMGERVSCAAMDNRAGCAILIETLKRLKAPKNEVIAVFTVQEEVGLRGAIPAAYQAAPDVGIALDVTLANDTPEVSGVATAKLGGGAAVKVMDASLISNPRVNDWLFAAAERENIAVQPDIIRAGGTDAGAMRASRGGVPSSAVSVACRYVHSPGEMIDMRDVEASVQLLLAALQVQAPTVAY